MAATPAMVAHYRITAKLGEGGMGAVYRATDTKLHREVAIKLLPDAFAEDPDRLARFVREAQVLASLNHPNIAAIYGVEERALVMELVPGEDLHGPLPIETALDHARQIALGLEAAHEKGIVHRDLKPANIKVTPEGVVKLLDFGLAKATEAGGNSNLSFSPTLTIGATQAGVIMGTAAYMAPEQARGKAVDKRADVWAFGVVLFEMLTGRQVFGAGETVTDIIAAVVTREPDWSLLPAATPIHIRRLLERCLRKDPKLRLRDIGEARIALDEPAVERPAQATGTPVRRIPWWAAAALVAASAGAAYWIGARPTSRPAAPLMRLSVDLGPGSIATTRFAAALSPDGTRIVFTVAGQDGRNQLATRVLSEDKATIPRGAEGGLDPIFSPDGQWIAFFAGGSLQKIPLQGGAPVVICAAENARGATWGEDGTIILSMGTTTGLWQVRDSGGPPQQITDPASQNELSHRWPQILPGGKAVLFTAHSSPSGFDDAQIAVLDLTTHHWKTVHHGGFFGRYLPSGHLVYVRQGTLYAVRFDLRRMETSGTPVPILEDVSASQISAGGRFDFAPADGTGIFTYMSGKALYARSPLLWVDAAGSTKPLLPEAVERIMPRLSPDGRLLAFASGNALATDIFIWDIERQTRSQLTFNSQRNAGPVWARDGKHLIFSSMAKGVFSFWWARSDGGGQQVKLLDAHEPLVSGSFSPDGRLFAYHQPGPGTGGDLWLLPLDLSDPEMPRPGKPQVFLQTPKAETFPVFSPDGRWIAYTSDENGQNEVYVRPFPGPGGKWLVSSGGGTVPRWSPAGRQIFYSTDAGRLMVSDYQTHGDSFTPGKPHPWVGIRLQTTAAGVSYDIAPDGKRVVAAVSDEGPEPASSLHLTFLLHFFDELKRKAP